MTARAVMVLGTSSGAGKSFVATALCRWYARRGLRVAPFKAQNMSNNARVVDGGEIGSAQYFQALAARAVPDTRMNPLLLKPEGDMHSQVVLRGRVDPALTAMPWRTRSEHVWPVIAASLDELRAQADVVVIEGAGSPAEINLQDSDIVNLRVARHASARCLLVTDIDRGGAFAHLYGTWALLPEADRRRLAGFVLNRFRGDARLLAPAPQRLRELTGVPTVATLPMWREHGLPQEDGWLDAEWNGRLEPAATVADGGSGSGSGVGGSNGSNGGSGGSGGSGVGNGSDVAGGRTRTIALIAYPRLSNLDEFEPLCRVPGLRVRWVRDARALAALSADDWIVLPGSKSTVADLAWLRARGLDARIVAHAARGGPVLGVCGGLQMLGEAIVDPLGVEGGASGTVDPLGGNAPGLGLLPLVTCFGPDKAVRATRIVPGALPAGCVWQALSGVAIDGYEIHNGQTRPRADLPAPIEVAPGMAWANRAGNVLGLYLHGLFEDPRALAALFGARAPSLEAVFDGLADFVDRHVEPGVLDALIR
ncbi:MAG: cobyric acid synthase [Burkholderiaceae bacterium]